MNNEVKTVTTVPVLVGSAFAEDLKVFLDSDILDSKIRFVDDVVEVLLNVHAGIGMDLDPEFFIEAEQLKSDLRKIRNGILEGEEYRKEDEQNE